jgi:Cu/Ag efflux pump CusA
LAWVIIGGLVSSTLIARLVTPVMYKLLAPSTVAADQLALIPSAGLAAAH